MTAPVSAPARDLSRIYLLLALAVVVGVVAALLVAAAPPPPAPHAGQFEVQLPTQVWGVLFLAPLLAGIGGLLFQRATQGRASPGRGALVAILVVVALLIALGVILALATPGPQGTVSVGTSNPPPNPGNNSTHHSGGGGTTTGATGSTTVFTFTSWDLLAVVAIACTVVGLLTVPGTISRLVDRSRNVSARAPADPAAVRAALSSAAGALDRGADPRETIVSLYVRLLSLVEVTVGDVSALTAGEIRSRVLERLGVRPAAARELTALFEDARYSSHPLGPDDAARCRAVLVAVERDLAGSRPA